MGNSLGGRNKAKVMKISGESFKLRTPILAGDVVRDYPGHVVLESECVKRYGVRAQPLEAHQQLQPRRTYFLVELPVFPRPDHHGKAPRRVKSEINMTAKDRLECLMLSRRSVSDLSKGRPSSEGGPMQVKLRIPRAQLAMLVEESKDGVDVGEKIVDFYIQNTSCQLAAADGKKSCLHGRATDSSRRHEKRVSFDIVEENGRGWIDLAKANTQ